MQKAYETLNYSLGDFLVTERAAAEIVSLPMYPQLTSEQQEKVAGEVASFTAKFQCKSADLEQRTLIPAAPIA
jgi:dTDP-4-amino-4,6-dideoxygalactose transaminase